MPPDALAEETLRPFARPLTRAPKPPSYRLAAAGVAAVMVTLPLLYVALIAALSAGVVWYARHGLIVVEVVQVAQFAVLVYLGPLVIGGLMVLFLVKPS